MVVTIAWSCAVLLVALAWHDLWSTLAVGAAGSVYVRRAERRHRRASARVTPTAARAPRR
jgi:hypothetical protein